MRIWAFCVGLPFGLPRSFSWQQLEHGRLSRLKVMTQNRFRFAALDLSLPFKLFFLQLTTRNDGKTRAWSRLSVYKTDNNLQFETFDVAQCPSFIFLLASYGLKRAGILLFRPVPFCDHLEYCLPIFSLCSCLMLCNGAGATLLLNFAHVCQRTECCSHQNQRRSYRPGS